MYCKHFSTQPNRKHACCRDRLEVQELIITRSHEAYLRGDEAFCRHYHQYKLNKTV